MQNLWYNLQFPTIKGLIFYPFCWLLLISLFYGCDADSLQSNTKPDSAGKIDEIIVIMADSDWKGEVGNVFRETIGGIYPGLPQGEDRFDLRHISFNAFKGLFRRSSTVVYVSPSNCDSPLCQHVKEAFTHYEKQGNDYIISFKNVYAEPQKVVYVSAPDSQGLISTIIEGQNRIIKSVGEIEDKKAYNNAYASRTNKGYTDLVKKTANINCPIPNSYRLVVEEKDCVWFRQDLEGAVSNLVFHVKQLDSLDFDEKTIGIEMRDNYGKLYVQSDTEGSYMMSDTLIPPDFEQLSINDKMVNELRGLWYLTEDFMGGPYINYTWLDKANNQVIMMDGWIYAPQWKKRPQIRRVEQIFKNAEI